MVACITVLNCVYVLPCVADIVCVIQHSCCNTNKTIIIYYIILTAFHAKITTVYFVFVWKSYVWNTVGFIFFGTWCNLLLILNLTLTLTLTLTLPPSAACCCSRCLLWKFFLRVWRLDWRLKIGADIAICMTNFATRFIPIAIIAAEMRSDISELMLTPTHRPLLALNRCQQIKVWIFIWPTYVRRPSEKRSECQ